MKKVKIYTLSTCPWCKKTKQFFKDNNIPFEYIDYDLVSEKEQERILEDMKSYGKKSVFPFVIIDNDAVSGYNPDKYKELLEL